MVVKVGMPNLGHTMEQGTLQEWLKKIGESVAADEPIGVVETDKVAVEIVAPGDGVLLQTLCKPGDEVPVGATVAIIGNAGESDEAARVAVSLREGDVAEVTGEVPETDYRPVTTPNERTKDEPPRASPAARAMARQHGLDLATVVGTGPRGFVNKEDVKRAIEDENHAALDSGKETSGIEAIPLSGMRERIAVRMSSAWREIPMVTLISEVDVTTTRAWLGDRPNVGFNDLLLAATARSLHACPYMNAWLKDGAVHRVDRVNLCVAVNVENGLLTPVISGADELSLGQLHEAVVRIAALARDNALEPVHLADGTFTVTSLGRWGVDVFAPIINPPQVGILGAGRLRREPRVLGDEIRVRDVVNLSLVFDHRALDGAAGADFLADVGKRLSDVDALAEPNDRSID